MPSNLTVSDIKPVNLSVTDIKPKNNSVSMPTTIYINQVTIPVGQWIPFLGLTYPIAITVQQTRL